MFRYLRWPLCAALLAGVGSWSEPAASAAYQCRKGDSTQGFEVQADDPSSGLPCRVVLWQTPEFGEVLWQARYDREFCRRRVEELRGRFADEGWRCAATAKLRAVGQVRQVAETKQNEQAGQPLTKPVASEDGIFRCRLDGVRRELRIGVGDAATGLPCEVLYKPTQRAKESVLWRADHEAEFCVEKVTETIAAWSSTGWQCDGAVQEAAAAAAKPSTAAAIQAAGEERAAANTPAKAPAAQAERPIEPVKAAAAMPEPERAGPAKADQPAAERKATEEKPEPAQPSDAKPVAIKAAGEAGPAEPKQAADQAAPPKAATAAAVAPEAASAAEPAEREQVNGVQTAVAALDARGAEPKATAEPSLPAPAAGPDAPPTPASPAPGEPSAAKDDAKLKAVVEQDMRMLEGMTDGTVAVTIGGHGDLDGDGQADAVVLARYQSELPLSRLLLMVYLADGPTYRLTDAKVLEQAGQPGKDIEIEAVANGQIALRLRGEGDDGRLVFALKGRELIRTDGGRPLAAAEETP